MARLYPNSEAAYEADIQVKKKLWDNVLKFGEKKNYSSICAPWSCMIYSRQEFRRKNGKRQKKRTSSESWNLTPESPNG